MCPSSYRSGFSSTSATTMLSSPTCSASHSVATSTSFAYPVAAISASYSSDLPWRPMLQPAGGPEDPPHHVEAERDREREAHYGDRVADPGHERGRDEERRDDQRGADAVR